MSDLEQSHLRGNRARKRPLDVSEQLAFQQRRGQGRAIAGQQGAVAAAAVPVDRPRHHLLAGPAFTTYQHGALGRRDTLDQCEHVAHRRAASQDALEPPRCAAGQPLRLRIGGRGGRRLEAAQDRVQLLRRTRLLEIVRGAFLDCRHGRLDGPRGAENNHLCRHVRVLELAEDVPGARRRLGLVDKDSVEATRNRRLHAGQRIRKTVHVVLGRVEHLPATRSTRAITANNEYFQRHDRSRCRFGRIRRGSRIGHRHSRVQRRWRARCKKQDHAAPAAAAGRWIVKVVPLPGTLSTSSVPPCC